MRSNSGPHFGSAARTCCASRFATLQLEHECLFSFCIPSPVATVACCISVNYFIKAVTLSIFAEGGCKSWTDIGPVHNPNSRLPVNKAKGKTAYNHTQTDQTNRAKSSSDMSRGGTAGSSCGWARYLRFSWVPLLRVACSSDLYTQPNMRFCTFGTTGAALTNSNTFASPETATPSIIAKGRFESPWASLEEKMEGRSSRTIILRNMAMQQHTSASKPPSMSHSSNGYWTMAIDCLMTHWTYDMKRDLIFVGCVCRFLCCWFAILHGHRYPCRCYFKLLLLMQGLTLRDRTESFIKTIEGQVRSITAEFKNQRRGQCSVEC